MIDWWTLLLILGCIFLALKILDYIALPLIIAGIVYLIGYGIYHGFKYFVEADIFMKILLLGMIPVFMGLIYAWGVVRGEPNDGLF